MTPTTTLILDQLRQWQGEGGPTAWRASWDRTLDLVGPLWGGLTLVYDGVVLADGAASLTTVLYLAAHEHGVQPGQVTRQQVEELRRRPDTAATTTKDRLETLLLGAGHDPHDPIDPVSVTWQRIWTDPSPPDNAPDWVWEEDSIRVGPVFYESIDYVLAPRWALAF